MKEGEIWQNLWFFTDRFVQSYSTHNHFSQLDRTQLSKKFQTFFPRESYLHPLNEHPIKGHKTNSKITQFIQPSTFQEFLKQSSFDSQFAQLLSWFDIIFATRKESDRKKIGQEFTPIPIISRIVSQCRTSFSLSEENYWLDMGSGAGYFIGYVLMQKLVKFGFGKNSHGGPAKHPPSDEFLLVDLRKKYSKMKKNLLAVEIDPPSITATSVFTTIITLLHLNHSNIRLTQELLGDLPPVTIISQDFLSFSSLPENTLPTIIFGNPPYLFYRNLPKEILERLRTQGFQSTKGQFDLSDVFIEHALSILPPKGILAVIIPEIILTLDSRYTIRDILLKSCEKLSITHVSETFKNPSVENILLYAQKGSGEAQQDIQVSLNGKQVYTGPRVNIAPSQNSSIFFEPNQENEIISWIDRNFHSINEWNKIHPESPIQVFRGVELSKKGTIMQCTHCSRWMPVSNKRIHCPHCQSKSLDKTQIKTIVLNPNRIVKKQKKTLDYAPFIQNFSHETTTIKPDSVILLNYKGINYKDASKYSLPRIIVRQLLANLHICAACVDANIYTSQSIYNICLPEELQNQRSLLVKYLRSEFSAYYLYEKFSKGKRLFPRILINKLKSLPFIPNNNGNPEKGAIFEEKIPLEDYKKWIKSKLARKTFDS